MSRQTGMLLKPSLEECVAAAVRLKMPESEGRKFFYHYESVGWKVGKLAMVSFAGALGGWHERWLERGGSIQRPGSYRPESANGNGALSGADKMLKRDEYQRCLDRMKVIYSSYDSHLEMRADDRQEIARLKRRRDELRKELGIMI